MWNTLPIPFMEYKMFCKINLKAVYEQIIWEGSTLENAFLLSYF